MLRAPRQKGLWLRSLVFVLFALGLVLQPVLATAGEVHDLQHDPAGLHAHDMQADAAAQPDEADEPGAAGTLHVLLHFAHCCGATAAVLYDLTPVGWLVRANPVPDARSQVHAQAPSPAPFKPPIVA